MISLVLTVRNEAGNMARFLSTLKEQTVLPDEVVIVDGASTDGTLDVIHSYGRWLGQRLITGTVEGNIASGRNRAVQLAKGQIVAVTDGGCRLATDWLERLTKPLIADSSVDVVAGGYANDSGSFFQQCVGTLTCRAPKVENGTSFLPSSRSIAFRKSAWESVGGYPENLMTAEDTAFDMALKSKGFRFVYCPDAIVFWEQRRTLREVLRQYYRYSYGDGMAGIRGANHIRLAVFHAGLLLSAALSGVTQNLLWLGPLAVMCSWYVTRRLSRSQIPSPRLFAIPVILGTSVLMEYAMLWGFIRGRAKCVPNLHCSQKVSQ